MLIRMAYMAAVVLPVLFEKEIAYPPIINFFMTVSVYGYAYAFMPYQTHLYPIISLLPLLVYGSRGMRPNSWIIVLFIYTFLVDCISSLNSDIGVFQNSFYCYLLIIFFSLCTIDSKEVCPQMELSFALVSIFISILFLRSGNQFVESYGGIEAGDLTRTSWTDPNYLGCVIGMGASISLTKLILYFKEENLYEKLIYLAAVLVSIPVLILNASRGAILAVAAASFVVIFFSNLRFIYKVAITISSIILLLVLFNSGYFELLVYRVKHDDLGGSNRLEYWQMYWNLFWDGSILSIIFGNGLVHGQNLAGREIGFHNDFLAFLVEYGIIGFLIFLSMFFSFFRHHIFNRRNKTQLLSAVVFLVMCCLTLEPITSGFAAYYFFLYYICLLYSKNRLDSNNSINISV